MGRRQGAFERLELESDSGSSTDDFVIPKTEQSRRRQLNRQMPSSCTWAMAGAYMALFVVFGMSASTLFHSIRLARQVQRLETRQIEKVQEATLTTPDDISQLKTQLKDLTSKYDSMVTGTNGVIDLKNSVETLDKKLSEVDTRVGTVESKWRTTSDSLSPKSMEGLQQSVADMGSRLKDMTDKVGRLEEFEKVMESFKTDVQQALQNLKPNSREKGSEAESLDVPPELQKTLKELQANVSSVNTTLRDQLSGLSTQVQKNYMSITSVQNTTRLLSAQVAEKQQQGGEGSVSSAQVQQIVSEAVKAQLGNGTAAGSEDVGGKVEVLTQQLSQLNESYVNFAAMMQSSDVLRNMTADSLKLEKGATTEMDQVLHGYLKGYKAQLDNLPALNETVSRLNASVNMLWTQWSHVKNDASSLTTRVTAISGLVQHATTPPPAKADTVMAPPAKADTVMAPPAKADTVMAPPANPKAATIPPEGASFRSTPAPPAGAGELTDVSLGGGDGGGATSGGAPAFIQLPEVKEEADLPVQFVSWNDGNTGKLSYEDLAEKLKEKMISEADMKFYDLDGDGLYSLAELHYAFGFRTLPPTRSPGAGRTPEVEANDAASEGTKSLLDRLLGTNRGT